jgi:hypothetical protein
MHAAGAGTMAANGAMMPELGEEARGFFAAKRRFERMSVLAVIMTGGAILVVHEMGFPQLGPYLFTIGCIVVSGLAVDRAIDAAVRRAREP